MEALTALYVPRYVNREKVKLLVNKLTSTHTQVRTVYGYGRLSVIGP